MRLTAFLALVALVLMGCRTAEPVVNAMDDNAIAADPVANVDDTHPMEAEPAATEIDTEGITAAVIALDQRWGEAASRGDATAALSCFSPTEGFSFVFDGGSVPTFEEFAELTRQSYASRASLETSNLWRRVMVVSADVAMLTGETHVTLTSHEGAQREADMQYGLLCTKEAGEWKIVHAYEFVDR